MKTGDCEIIKGWVVAEETESEEGEIGKGSMSFLLLYNNSV